MLYFQSSQLKSVDAVLWVINYFPPYNQRRLVTNPLLLYCYFHIGSHELYSLILPVHTFALRTRNDQYTVKIRPHSPSYSIGNVVFSFSFFLGTDTLQKRLLVGYFFDHYRPEIKSQPFSILLNHMIQWCIGQTIWKAEFEFQSGPLL